MLGVMKPLRLVFLGSLVLTPACANVVQESGPPGGGDGAPAAWHAHLAGPGDQGVTATTIAPDGRVILCGASQGWADLGSGFTAGKGTQDLFVTSFAADGALVFSRRFAAGAVACNGVVTDPDGNILLTGAYSVEPLVLGEALPADPTLSRAFVAKLDPSGKPVWAAQVAPPYSNAVSGALALRPDGTIVLAGIQEEGLFTMEISPSGEVESSAVAGAMSPGWWPGAGVRALAIDTDGNLFVTGNYASYVSLGQLQENGVYDRGFVARLTATGEAVWAFGFGATGNSHFNTGSTLQLDAAGDLVVAGYSSPDVPPGQDTGGKSLFVRKFRRGNGEVAWEQTLGDHADGAFAALDTAGDVVFVTSQSQPTTIAGTQVPAGTFLVHLEGGTGAIQSVRPVPEIAAPQTLAVGPNDEVVLTAPFSSDMSTSFGTLKSAGAEDAFAVGLGVP